MDRDDSTCQDARHRGNGADELRAFPRPVRYHRKPASDGLAISPTRPTLCSPRRPSQAFTDANGPQLPRVRLRARRSVAGSLNFRYRDGVTVIPVGKVRFGFGGGGGSDAGGKGEGEGGGGVGTGGPAGYIELKEGRSRFVPIVHPARLLALICATFTGAILIAQLGRGRSHRSRAWHRFDALTRGNAASVLSRW
jgi:hypothetical protein